VRATIPAGASILLTDGGGLYTRAFAGLLGADYRYFATYETIYDSLFPSLAVERAAVPTDYALLYEHVPPETYGCARDSVVWSNESVEMCRRTR
jgi:hypothetical protein